MVAMDNSDDVILLPGYVTETTWRVVVPFFCLMACSTIKFAVFRSICPRFSGECNQTWGCKVTTMRPLGAQTKSVRTHIHMDTDKFSKNATTKKGKTEESTQQESIGNDKKDENNAKENGTNSNNNVKIWAQVTYKEVADVLGDVGLFNAKVFLVRNQLW